MFNLGCKSAVCPPAPRRNRRGVSIIEMLIVMMMIGTITAMVLPKVRAAIRVEVDNGDVHRGLVAKVLEGLP